MYSRQFVFAVLLGKTSYSPPETILTSSLPFFLINAGSYENAEINLDTLLNSLVTPEGTLLHLAVKENQTDIVRALLNIGADPGIQNDAGRTALECGKVQKVLDVFNEGILQAVAKSDIGRICQLVAAGISVNVVDTPSSRNSPLHWAASYANRDTIHCLCKRGGDVNAVNANGATPLHDAVLRGDQEVLAELLAAGANPNIKASSGKHANKSPLDIMENSPNLINVLENFRNLQIANGSSTDLHEGSLDDSLSEDPKDFVTNISTSATPSLPTTPLTPNGGIPGPNFMHKPKVRSDSGGRVMQPVPALVTDSRLNLLWPRPQKLIQRPNASPFQPENLLHIAVTATDNPGDYHKVAALWWHHNHYLQRLGLGLHTEVHTPAVTVPPTHSLVHCEVSRHLLPHSKGYSLSITGHKVKLLAASTDCLHHGITTFIQLLRLCRPDGIPALQIQDHPMLQDRAVLLDVSKGRIPTLDCLRHLIVDLSFLKINQLQLYVRFSVLKDPELSWQFPYSNSALLELDHFCESLGILLVPVLDVAPKVCIDNLPGLFPSMQQLLTCFITTNMVGLGPRLSSLVVEVTDDGHVNNEDVYRLLHLSPTMIVQLCGFIFHGAPHSLKHFPTNCVLAEYGFQANQDFGKPARLYEENGVPFCLVPGTAAWNSMAGCPEAAVSNIYSAIHNTVVHGGLGVIVSSWAGIGQLAHQCMNWPGLITAAGLAWNQNIHIDFVHGNLAELLNLHILEDGASMAGQVILELGRAETYLLRCARNQPGDDNSQLPAEKGSTLYQLLTQPDLVSLENLSLETFQKAMRHVRKCQSELSQLQLYCVQSEAVVAELQLTADLMLSACRVGRALVTTGRNPIMGDKAGCAVINPGISNLAPTTKTDLANRLLLQVDMYRSVWQQRSLPHSLADSLLMLSSLLRQLVPDQGDTKLVPFPT